MPHHCAFGCKNANTGVVMHMFPNPKTYPKRFSAWVNLLGDKLGNLSDNDIYIRKRICDIHFTDEHRNRFKRLNALAMPTLHLPGTFTPAAVVISNKATDFEPMISASTSQLTVAAPDEPARIPLATKLSEHNYSAMSRPSGCMQSKAALPIYNCGRMKPLIQAKTKYLRNEIRRLRKQAQSFKERLLNAEKLSNLMAFNQITKYMTKPAQLFAHMQLQNQKKPKGRRFSVEEKILSASLFKKSPKCYKLLSKYFTLPSAKSMKCLLSQIKLTPGINEIIFKKIKETVSRKDISDRLCTLIFEMAITPHIAYNAKKDILEGFGSNQEYAFADHVLVFMVKGIKSNFKQPVAYYFTNSLSKLELKNLIKCVAEHTLESGLIIISTVCDQSPVNVGAITELINESRASHLRRGKEWGKDMFYIKKQCIIPLFDTPHLIKGLRNNLINRDLIYVINGQQKTIKWKYFQMVYEADKEFKELRLLNKLTEAQPREN